MADLFGAEKAATLRSDDPAARATVSARLLFRCETTLSLLRQLDTWPRGQLAGTRAKTMLAAAVFERCPGLRNSPAQAGEIVTGIRHGVLTEAALNQPTGRRVVYLIALRALEGLRDVTPSTLAARLQTGTDFEIAPVSRTL